MRNKKIIAGMGWSWSIIFLFAAIIALSGDICFGQADTVDRGKEVKHVALTVGRSVIIKNQQQVTRAEVEDTKIAAVTAISPTEIYLLGKEAGTTYMQLWSDKTVSGIYTIEVAADTVKRDQTVRDGIPRLKNNLSQLMPEEKDIRIISSGDSILLAGKVSSASNLAQAMALTQSYAPEGKVQNLLEVTGNHQVMLEVRVAEMSRILGRELGVNIHYNNNGNTFGVGMLDQLTQLVKPEDAYLSSGPLGFLVSPSVNAMFRFNKGSATWTGFIDALREDGLLKVLAEPNLISLSGQWASFLAGGEFPVPVPQGLGTAAIEWKTYGVGLNFKPVVLSNNRINITVEPTVSEPDPTLQVVLNGSYIPALKTRTAKTVVELGDGQSFAIAGLLSNNVRNAVAKYPLLGEIPVLGQLFSSRQFQKNETELVIFVTPHLVKPMSRDRQPLPTDSYKEPDDLDFYLWGNMESSKQDAQPQVTGKLEGDYGHAVPPPDVTKQ